MKLSFSKIKMFQRCARQWYYKQYVVNHKSADGSVRREAFLLSQLDTVWSWRGKIVDKVISEIYIPGLQQGKDIALYELLAAAEQVFYRQLQYAKEHKLRQGRLKKSAAKSEFAAFRDVEYGSEIAQEDIANAWNDIERALSNLLDMEELQELLKSASSLLPQRFLHFEQPYFSTLPAKVTAVPDLIALFSNLPPLIVDWKVHTFGNVDYRKQLTLYALALFKSSLSSASLTNKFMATDISLREVQLLTGQQRIYTVDASDIDALDEYLTEMAIDMSHAINGVPPGTIDPMSVPATTDAAVCDACNFKALCWKESKCQPRQTALAF